MSELKDAQFKCQEVYGRLPHDGEAFMLDTTLDEQLSSTHLKQSPVLRTRFIARENGELKLKITVSPMQLHIVPQEEKKEDAPADGPRDQHLTQTVPFINENTFPKE